MKVRKDFVTNSSSSSFIIAKRGNCTIDEIKSSLSKKTDDIREILEMCDMECDDSAIETFINELSSQLLKEPDVGLQLGEWKVSSTEYSNEDDEFGAFMYDYGYMLSTENFKVG